MEISFDRVWIRLRFCARWNDNCEWIIIIQKIENNSKMKIKNEEEKELFFHSTLIFLNISLFETTKLSVTKNKWRNCSLILITFLSISYFGYFLTVHSQTSSSPIYFDQDLCNYIDSRGVAKGVWVGTCATFIGLTRGWY